MVFIAFLKKIMDYSSWFDRFFEKIMDYSSWFLIDFLKNHGL